MSWLWGSHLDPELKAFARDRAAPSDVPIAHESPASTASISQPGTVAKEPELSDELQTAINHTKTRKAQINSGAMFNCAEAQYELKRCFTEGSWWDKSKLCEMQKGIFWDCLEANRKALTVLGYGEFGNTQEYDQQLLETADDLFLKQQKAKKSEMENGS